MTKIVLPDGRIYRSDKNLEDSIAEIQERLGITYVANPDDVAYQADEDAAVANYAADFAKMQALIDKVGNFGNGEITQAIKDMATILQTQMSVDASKQKNRPPHPSHGNGNTPKKI